MTQEKHTGKLLITKHGWHFQPDNIAFHSLPIYYQDVELAEKINSLNLNHKVEALMIDEFSHPELFRNISWGKGTWCYKITNAENLLQ